MSRGDRRAAAAAAAAAGLTLGGCMRIYPDPELPDVVVEWTADFECREGGARVTVALAAPEPAAPLGPVTVPCTDGSVRFDDVARLRYQVAAKLEDEAGTMLGNYEQEIDLRDGLSEKVFAFFQQGFGINFHVAWTFDMGASCESLAATSVQLEAVMPGGGPMFSFEAPCHVLDYVDTIPLSGTYTLKARALAADAVVAVSPDSAPLMVVPFDVTEFGTLTLSPCGTACPPLGRAQR